MEMNIEANSSFELSKCNKGISNASDGMNLLPDEILVSILSCLTLKEAARTSVLSSRWRFLWTYFKGKMDFVWEDWEIDKDQFVIKMNEILKLHRGTGVERFRILIDGINYSMEDFNIWIEFAAKKSVQRLQLIFGSDDSMFHLITCITEPLFLNSFCFKSLQSLILSSVDVDDETVEYFLTNCPNLQHIDLRYSSSLTNILIPSSSLRLKEFCVVECDNLKKIQIFAGSLEEFVYFGPKISVEVEVDLHRLRLVYYGGFDLTSLFEGNTLLRRSFSLYQLEHLTLGFRYVDDYFLSHKDHFSLPKLKTLVLVIDTVVGNEMLKCLHLLEAAPILHSFTVHVFRNNCYRQGFRAINSCFAIDKIIMHRHQCLKVVKIVNHSRRHEVDAHFVKTLMKLIVVPHKFPNMVDEMEESTLVILGNRLKVEVCQQELS